MHTSSSDASVVGESGTAAFLTEYVATRWYRAPEIMLSWKAYTAAIDVWSVGCIMAEIIARQPLFPGRDYMDQLQLILDCLGTPSHADSEYIASEKAKAFIRSLSYRPPIPLAQLLPNATPLALDLLSKMLTFAPEKRISVADALAHPYLRLLHDPNDEPIAANPLHLDAFERDFSQLTPMQNEEQKQTLRSMLLDEIQWFNHGALDANMTAAD